MSNPTFDPPDSYECPECGMEIEHHEGHECECGEEISEKQCKNNGGFCYTCTRLLTK